MENHSNSEPKNKYKNQKRFWEYAGEVGYGEAIFANPMVEKHIVSKQWKAVLHTAKMLGLNKDSKVLELGCGDGLFSNQVLAHHFKQVDAFERSKSAVKRAEANCLTNNVNFQVKDLATHKYSEEDYWDGVFLVGFLHHVKAFAPKIISRLIKVSPKVVVLEPNGDNIIRKALELSPSHKSAGEDSMRLKDLTNTFQTNGYNLKYIENINFVPQFCPEFILPFLAFIEKFIERKPFLSRFRATYILGFERG